jgi:hypothetical protein
MTRPADLPDYASPPVNEVVVGIQFQRLAVTGVHIGSYWGSISDRFPKVSELPPLEPRVENFADPAPPVFPISFALARAESRYWFTTPDEVELLQIQPDRLVFNWRAMPGGPPYPHFEAVQANFWNHFNQWRSFAIERGLTLHQISFADRPTLLDEALSFVGGNFRTGLGGAPESAQLSSQRVLLASDGRPWARGFING